MTRFACNSLTRWQETQGRHDHSQATQLLMLANRIGMELRMAHYPPYCSKHNPIERRVFPHITRTCEGVVVESVPLVKPLIERSQTLSGLRLTMYTLDHVYETGRKAAQHLKAPSTSPLTLEQQKRTGDCEQKLTRRF